MIINGNKFPAKSNKAALLTEKEGSAWNWKDIVSTRKLRVESANRFSFSKMQMCSWLTAGEFCKGDVAVEDGIVIGVGEYEGETEIDLDGKYLCPGFIDSHLHLESTLVTPGELIRQAAQCGTTTFHCRSA